MCIHPGEVILSVNRELGHDGTRVRRRCEVREQDSGVGAKLQLLRRSVGEQLSIVRECEHHRVCAVSSSLALITDKGVLSLRALSRNVYTEKEESRRIWNHVNGVEGDDTITAGLGRRWWQRGSTDVVSRFAWGCPQLLTMGL